MCDPGDSTPNLPSYQGQSPLKRLRGIPTYVAERSTKEGGGSLSSLDSTASRESGASKDDVATVKPAGADVGGSTEAAMLKRRRRKIRATKRQMTVVVAGKSGAGKTALVKRLFGIRDLETKMAATAVTEDYTHEHTREGITLKFIETISSNKKKLAEQAKGKVDLLLYCLPISPGSRFHDYNPEIMKSLQDAFGKGIWRHCMVVLTFSNLAWSRISMDFEKQEDTIAEYKRFVTQYAERFKQELEHLGTEYATTELVLDQQLDFLTSFGSNRVVFVPTGYTAKDPIIPGVDYKFKIKVAPHVDISSASSDSSDEASDDEQRVKRSEAIDVPGEPQQPQNKTEVIPHQWMDILVLEIMKRSDLETNLALLLFWYGRKRIRAAFKRHDVCIKHDVKRDAERGVEGGVGTGPVGMSELNSDTPTPDILTGIVVESLIEKKTRK